MTLLSTQVLALTLIPILSGVVPGSSAAVMDLPAVLGIDRPVERSFMVGSWKYSDLFVRWGITDKRKASVTGFSGNAFMSLEKDGTMKMVNLFKPDSGLWEMTGRGLVIHDPEHPERGSQLIPVRKRDDNRVWLLLPFAGGATGIGMVRVPTEELRAASSKPERRPATETRPPRVGSSSGRGGGSGYNPDVDLLDPPAKKPVDEE
jgi:hypothetical protein